MNIMQEARVYGKQVVNSRALLPELALKAAQAVVSGDVEATDAKAIYIAYLDAEIKRSPQQHPVSQKVQISKLRQIMKLAEERPKQVMRLLCWVTELHREGNTMPLFPAMVEMSRVQLTRENVMTKAEIAKVITP